METGDCESMLRELAIPPRPEVVMVLFEEVRTDAPDLNRIVKAIVADPGISVGMLRSANSPFFSLSRKVLSVPQAVKVRGLKHVANIAHGLALRNAFKSAGQAAFSE
jgi:HD-like signal output (HDOD) protein